MRDDVSKRQQSLPSGCAANGFAARYVGLSCGDALGVYDFTTRRTHPFALPPGTTVMELGAQWVLVGTDGGYAYVNWRDGRVAATRPEGFGIAALDLDDPALGPVRSLIRRGAVDSSLSSRRFRDLTTSPLLSLRLIDTRDVVTTIRARCGGGVGCKSITLHAGWLTWVENETQAYAYALGARVVQRLHPFAGNVLHGSLTVTHTPTHAYVSANLERPRDARAAYTTWSYRLTR